MKKVIIILLLLCFSLLISCDRHDKYDQHSEIIKISIIGVHRTDIIFKRGDVLCMHSYYGAVVIDGNKVYIGKHGTVLKYDLPLKDDETNSPTTNSLSKKYDPWK